MEFSGLTGSQRLDTAAGASNTEPAV
jgi:hypothetical protein